MIGPGAVAAMQRVAGFPTHPTARYYEIRPLGNAGADSNFAATTFARIEFAATPSGANIATSGMFSSSPALGFGSFANFVDGNNSTIAGFIKIYGSYIRIDFGSPTTIAEIRLVPRSSTFARQAPGAFAVRLSNDAVTWTTYFTHGSCEAFNSGSSPVITVPLGAPVSATAWHVWGIDVSSTGGGTLTIDEMVWANSIGGANVAAFNAFGCPVSPLYTAAPIRLADGTTAAFQVGESLPASVGWAFMSPQNFAQLRITGMPTTNQGPTNFTIWKSPDGITKTTIQTVSSITWSASETKSYTL
jgi:hypothetical protein